MRMCGVFLAMLALTEPAITQSALPRFPVEAHCRQVAGFGGSYSQSLYGGCMDMEQQAYDKLQKTWMTLPQSM